MNLPNKITLGRLLLAFVFFILASFEDRLVLDWALTVYIFACMSDYFDGYFARKLGQVTALGRIADPFVDKVIVCGGFALLTNRAGLGHVSIVAPWMVVVLISREFLVTGIRGYAESRGIEFGAELSGKIKAAFQMVALGFALYFYGHGDLPFLPPAFSKLVTLILIYVALVMTALSAATYIFKARKLFGPDGNAP